MIVLVSNDHLQEEKRKKKREHTRPLLIVELIITHVSPCDHMKTLKKGSVMTLTTFTVIKCAKCAT